MINTVNTVNNYIFGSPRYNCVSNFNTMLIPEDYGYWNSINGTYDPNFPLFSLTESVVPKLELINQTNQIKELKGDLSLKLEQPEYKTKTIGANNLKAKFKNSNLQSKTVVYNSYSSIKLNPAWCVIQCGSVLNQDNKYVYKPRFLVRVLGNTKATKQLYSVPLKRVDVNNKEFIAGSIIKDKDNLWKCTKNTKNYPPNSSKQNITEFWELIVNDNNVFNADLFLMSENNTTYFKEVKDKNRKFNPLVKDSTLICWNLAYWQD